MPSSKRPTLICGAAAIVSRPSADSSGDEPPFDPARIAETLARHGVEYLLVGGMGARVHGASRPTKDLDCLPRADEDNMVRLAAAMRELGARLRIEGMSDEQSRQLTSNLPSPEFFRRDQISNWMTDAGPLDVLQDMPDRDGRPHRYEHYVERAATHRFASVTVVVADLGDIVASKEFSNRDKDKEALPELRDLLRRSPGTARSTRPTSRRSGDDRRLANGLDLSSPAKRPPERGVDR